LASKSAPVLLLIEDGTGRSLHRDLLRFLFTRQLPASVSVVVSYERTICTAAIRCRDAQSGPAAGVTA